MIHLKYKKLGGVGGLLPNFFNKKVIGLEITQVD